MADRKIVFWWNIPCAGMINVLKAYAEIIDTSATVVTGELSKSRKAMGWDDKGKLFDNHIVLSDAEWDSEGKRILDEYSEALHVFNGITYPARMRRLIDYAVSRNIAFANMSEAYFNLEHGIKRIVKSAFIKFILPIKVSPVSKHSLAAICLSGGSSRDLKQFDTLGFRKVFPFGYYTEENIDVTYSKAEDGKVHMICPGLLEHYKGVDIMVRAFGILKQRGAGDFVCHITGKGREYDKIRTMIEDLGLQEQVILEGVMDSESYNALLSKIDILVAPGRVEPWGIRINEAIQRGNVVIVSDGIGAHTLILESGGGDVFHSGDSEDLAEKLLPYLISDKTLENAKTRNLGYRHKISCAVQAKRLQDYINKLKK